jgi:tetratricopeptide (TPR) repeat protein
MELFDARRAMLIDEDRPHSEWRTVSLVSALRVALQEARPSDLVDHGDRPSLRSIVDELTARGFDGDSLVRFGLMPEIAVAVFAHVIVHWFPLLEETSSDIPVEVSLTQISLEMPPLPVLEENAWRTLLAPRVEAMYGPFPKSENPSFETLVRVISAVSNEIVAWVAASPLDNLLTLQAPPADFLDSLSKADTELPPTNVLNEYRWVVERFSLTRLTQWSTSSLHLEHEWQNGRQPASCSDSIMSDRNVTGSELTAEIARRAVQERNSQPMFKQVGLGSAVASKMQSRAIELLRAKRFREAATLYEFAVSQDPKDPHLINNLGFCLIRENPREALKHLQEAHRLGYTPIGVNIYNRAFCHVLLSEFRTALDLIEANWSQIAETPATLWILESEGPALKEGAGCKEQIVALALASARHLGDMKAVCKWEASQ